MGLRILIGIRKTRKNFLALWNYLVRGEQKAKLLVMRLLERLDRACKLAHFAKSTRVQYRRWVEQFLRFSRLASGRWRLPRELRGAEVGAFLTHLAADRRLSESSQNQAICAIVFLYETVLLDELGPDHVGGIFGRCARPARGTLPTVLSTAEVGAACWRRCRPKPSTACWRGCFMARACA